MHRILGTDRLKDAVARSSVVSGVDTRSVGGSVESASTIGGDTGGVVAAVCGVPRHRSILSAQRFDYKGFGALILFIFSGFGVSSRVQTTPTYILIGTTDSLSCLTQATIRSTRAGPQLCPTHVRSAWLMA